MERTPEPAQRLNRFGYVHERPGAARRRRHRDVIDCRAAARSRRGRPGTR
ncbi:hypothetical protein ACFPM0_35280 [Pseudonocardia sulfidoxydans]